MTSPPPARRGTLRRAIAFAFRLGLALLVLAAGCSKDETPAGPGPGPGTPPYGTGDLAFEAPSAGGAFTVTGAYLPSAEFADDSAGQGAGGFLHDTVAAGRPYQARLNAYVHALRSGLMSERVLVIRLDAGGALSTGDYAVVPDLAPPAGKTARVTYLFFSDSLAEYSVFEGAGGTISVSALDTTTGEITGTFSGTLRTPPPDTSRVISLTNGSFRIILAKRYYDY